VLPEVELPEGAFTEGVLRGAALSGTVLPEAVLPEDAFSDVVLRGMALSGTVLPGIAPPEAELPEAASLLSRTDGSGETLPVLSL